MYIANAMHSTLHLQCTNLTALGRCMGTKSLQVRLDTEEIEEIEKMAKASNTSSAAIARNFIREGLAGFDRKHSILLERIETLRGMLDQANLLSAMSVSAVSFIDASRIDGKVEAGQVRVKSNIQAAIKMGRVIKEMSDIGALTKDA